MKKNLQILLFVIIFSNLSASTIYVNASASGQNNGLSWSNAFTNLQEALSNAIYGDEIWVASGTYKTTTTTDRTISFVMKNGVNLYGGFSGNETSIAQRNISANPTTLSGDIGALGDNSDNTNTIIRLTSITSGLTVDGFRIISGRASSGTGGIAMNNNTGIININNCYFYNNTGTVGGAIFMAYQGNYTVNVNNCDFISNISVDGAIFADDSSYNNLNITNCRFKGSVAGGVAVIDFLGANLTIDRCIITNNSSSQSNLMYIDANSSAKISNTLIVGNSYYESAIAFYGISGVSQILENVTVAHNKKTYSTNTFHTAVLSANGTSRIYNSIIYGNTNSSNNVQIYSGNTVENSIVENGYSTGVNILNTNPLFTNPNTLNAAPFDCTAYDYTLQSTSPGINSGNNNYVTKTLDLAGNARIYQNIIDRGAYEYQTNLNTNDIISEKKMLFYDYNTQNLHLRDKNEGTIVIYDTSGRLIKNMEVKNILSLKDLENGVYYILLKETNNKLRIVKY